MLSRTMLRTASSLTSSASAQSFRTVPVLARGMASNVDAVKKLFKDGFPRDTGDANLGGFVGSPKENNYTYHQVPNERPFEPRAQKLQQWTLPSTLYQVVFRNHSTYVLFIIFGAIIGEEIYVNVVDTLLKARNRGKSWADIAGNYPNLPPGTEPDEDEDEDEEEE
jgi:hypothetical protein